MIVERKELFMPLMEDGRRDVLNCCVRGMTIRRIQQAMDYYNANISLAAGAINDPDMGSLPVNENNMHAFELDPLWEVLPEGKTDKTYTLTDSAAYPFDINTLISQLDSGTLDITISINGTPVTGISATGITSSQSTKTATALNSVAIGGRVTMVVASSSSPVDYTFTLKTTRT